MGRGVILETMNALMLLILLLLSGLFSGLTLGILSLSAQSLRHKSELGDKNAAKLLPLREQGTQLLITLVVTNVAVNAIISILLDSLTPSFVAVILATVFITLFGEILPQATIGRFGMRYAPTFAPLVGGLMWLMGPAVKPLAGFLDRKIGHELPIHMSKEELSKLVEEHSNHAASEITRSEQRIVEQALTISEAKVSGSMTPRKMIVAVKSDDILSPQLLDDLHQSGHSRFPVYKGQIDNVVGTLFIRSLVNMKGKKRVEDAMDKGVYFVNEEQTLEHVLHAFLRTKHHLFMAVNEFKEVVGVISIEDVIEHILGREIVDEFDRYDDLRAVARQTAPGKKLKASEPSLTKTD